MESLKNDKFNKFEENEINELSNISGGATPWNTGPTAIPGTEYNHPQAGKLLEIKTDILGKGKSSGISRP